MSNPFAELSAFVAPALMQAYVVAMILLVVAGTLFDVWHKRSARYFFDHWRKAKTSGKPLGSGRLTSLAVQTVASEVLTSSEFCNPMRRISHLLTMYGFLIYALTTVVLVFGYPTPDVPAPALLPALWYLGALMVCIGGYWFWFVMRVDVAAEGHSPFRIVQADLFILSLLASVTLGLIWAVLQVTGSPGSGVLLALYLLATTVLFGSVPWSKFSHMFFKPAAAFQKRAEEANGWRRNLPAPADSPAVYGSARRPPSHF